MELLERAVRLICRFLLDTHIIVWWLSKPGKLSREQLRVLRSTVQRHERVSVSAASLLEIAILSARFDGAEILQQIDIQPLIETKPLTLEIAREVGALGHSLRDPMDRAIVATARVHGLRLMTSDQRIIDSQMVATVA